MRCPICKKDAPYEGNPFRPFCSERCKLIDLDNWLSGRYRISKPIGINGAMDESPTEEQDAKGGRD